MPQVVDLQDRWPALAPVERFERFCLLPEPVAAAFFSTLDAHDQANIVHRISSDEVRASWLRLLAPDDAADVIQEVPPEARPHLLGLLDAPVREDIETLLTYAEDHAGGLMSPRFAQVRMEMTRDEALHALRRQAKRQLETPYYVYVLDRQQHLLGVVSFWELFSAPAHKTVKELMCTEVVTVTEAQDQEAVAAIIAQRDLLAVPVVDEAGRIKGIVTIDDIVDVVQEEATEDIQKLAAMEALDLPYLRTSFAAMLKKRAGWLATLFLGELLTATAMGHYEGTLARVVVLGLFVPLIISSGGNAGSQASTLMVRALALGDVRLRDGWRVIRRESLTGLALGTMLGGIGLGRILLWQGLFHTYGAHAGLIGLTVGLSLIGVVLWGTVMGSMLPFFLRRLGFDPASASAPLVATLVDVTGLVIYFSIARLVLRETLLQR
jgi:magnesium transporter